MLFSRSSSSSGITLLSSRAVADVGCHDTRGVPCTLLLLQATHLTLLLLLCRHEYEG
jgi:hypothetical protein